LVWKIEKRGGWIPADPGEAREAVIGVFCILSERPAEQEISGWCAIDDGI
jgi:hypothetical protein